MSDHPITKLETYWPYQAVVLADLVSRHTNSILKLHGSLNLSQWRVLAAIANRPGCTSAQVVIMLEYNSVNSALRIAIKQVKTPGTFNADMLEQIAGMLNMMSVE